MKNGIWFCSVFLPTSYLPALALILAVLGKEAAEEVAAAAGHVHQGALFAQAEARRHSQHQGDRLDQQRPLAQVAPDDEAAEDGLDLSGAQRKQRPTWSVFQRAPSPTSM